MLDPEELLDVARFLLERGRSGVPSNAYLRRAVSSAYYAVFHLLVGEGARRLMGAGHEHTAGFAVLYRGYDHRHMKRVCEQLQKTTLPDAYQVALHRKSVSLHLREFVATFPGLQSLRHMADYDPKAAFEPSNVSDVIDSAEFALKAFAMVGPDEKADYLALLLVGIRQ